jgi:hypothetical protein
MESEKLFDYIASLPDREKIFVLEQAAKAYIATTESHKGSRVETPIKMKVKRSEINDRQLLFTPENSMVIVMETVIGDDGLLWTFVRDTHGFISIPQRVVQSLIRSYKIARFEWS